MPGAQMLVAALWQVTNIARTFPAARCELLYQRSKTVDTVIGGSFANTGHLQPDPK
jgi:hypothetical protein